MSNLIVIPMNEETKISFEDCFIDDANTDATKYIYDNLKIACQDAKKSLRNKVTLVNKRDTEGQVKQVEFDLNDVDLTKYNLESKPDWLPKNITPKDNKPIELKLGDNTMKYLKIYGQIVGIRHEQYNIGEEEYNQEKVKELRENGAPEETIEKFLKSQEPQTQIRKSQIPKTLEEAIYTSIMPLIHKKIDDNDSKIFEKEYRENYPPAKSKK